VTQALTALFKDPVRTAGTCSSTEPVTTRSGSAGNCEQIALLLMVYPDIQGVRSGTTNGRWECQ
jgi:hypothetical protein